MIKAYWRLFRGTNLLILLLTLILLQYSLVHVADTAAFHVNWMWLILSVILIAASGNCINDCEDTVADAVNKGEQCVVGKRISIKTVKQIYTILTFIGLIIAIFPACQIHSIAFYSCFLLSAIGLYLYAKYLKRIALVGNILIAILTAAPLLLSCWFSYVVLEGQMGKNAVYIYLIYSGFAFLLTLIREVIKVVEDEEGDKVAGYQTLVIKIGVKKTNWILLALETVNTIAMALFVAVFAIEKWWILLIYALLLLLLPSIALMVKTCLASTKNDYHLLSSQVKLLMLAGVLSCVLLFTANIL
ncbi:MAG: UbiA family prenyltransferase [Bacteroidales bacterium]|nr:UbiA family prenyltransferase [Bacteroidales bacterium]